jgi:hypothetical protein
MATGGNANPLSSTSGDRFPEISLSNLQRGNPSMRHLR